MNKDNLRTETESLKKQAEELKAKIEKTYTFEEEPESIPLLFYLNSDLFTDEETALNEQLTEITTKAMRLEGDLFDKLSELTRAQHQLKNYENTLLEDAEADYVDLYKETDKEMQRVQKLSEDIENTYKSIQAIAYKRYFERLSYREIVNEAKDISKTLEVFNEEKLYELQDEKIADLFQTIKAVSLVGRYANDYYQLSLNAIIPTTYKDITEEGLKNFIRETIEDYFLSHTKALKATNQTTREIERKIINDTVEVIYRKLNVTVAETKAQQTLKMKRHAVDDYLLPTTEMHRDIFSGAIVPKNKPYTIFDYLDEQTKENKKVNAYLDISYSELEGVSGIEPFTPEQETLYNAIDTEFNAGNDIITTQQIYKSMLGRDSSAKLSESKREELTDTIESFAKTRVSIDNREYAKRTGKSEFIKQTKNLLYIDHLEKAEIDGKVLKDVWLIRERPILGVYAESIGQIRNVPMKLLQTGTAITYTPLREHLLRAIYYMKNERQKRKNRTILLAPVYEDKYNGADTHSKQRLTENAEKILRHWVREEFIHSYEFEYSEGTKREIARAESKGKSTQNIKRIAISIKIYFKSNKLTTEAQLNRVMALEEKKRGRKK